MNEKESEFLKWQLEYIMEQIKMSDNKANFLLVIHLALLGSTISQLPQIFRVFSNIHICCKLVLAFVVFFFLYGMARFFITFVYTVKPRINPREILGDDNYKSFIFWGDLAKIKVDDYKNIKLENIYEDLEKQIIINARIAKIKFDNVEKAYSILFFPTLTTFIILMILIILMRG
ncbi:MAG: DUF5706 domain-containing protein [Candidatus Desulfofervidaceae bacterium]|nr:DUF5706 domain-containing protein [Candidatus Desulfofervidaceae bacterium]